MIQIYFCPIKTLIHILLVWMCNLNMSQPGLSHTNCLWMLIKLNGCPFILSQKGSYFHRPCLIFFLKIYVSKGNSKISKGIGILYKSRDVLRKQCLKQLYFSFIHYYVSYANIAWVSTSRTSSLLWETCCPCNLSQRSVFTFKSSFKWYEKR